MQSKAPTVQAYLAELEPDRRAAIEAVRKTILANLDKDFAEGMSYGMIGYHVPHSIYPAGYHCDPNQPLPFAGLASQKNAMSLYLMGLYGSPDELAWFTTEWKKTGKKLDMGKSCIRFKKLEDLPLELIGRAIKRVKASAYIKAYEANLGAQRAARSADKPAKSSAKKAAKKTAKKAAKKSTSSTAAARPTKKPAKKTARAKG